jgi:hypothetical protein
LKMPIALYSNPREVKPLTGEPDAGDPHVRFGGRGGANQCVIPTPIVLEMVPDFCRDDVWMPDQVRHDGKGVFINKL